MRKVAKTGGSESLQPCSLGARHEGGERAMDDSVKNLEERVTALERKVQALSTSWRLWIATTVIVSATLAIQLLSLLR